MWCVILQCVFVSLPWLVGFCFHHSLIRSSKGKHDACHLHSYVQTECSQPMTTKRVSPGLDPACAKCGGRSNGKRDELKVIFREQNDLHGKGPTAIGRIVQFLVI